MLNNKKGISAIVATLMIILLAIIAFGIVSVVVRNTIQNTGEDIELNQKCLDVQMHATKIAEVPNSGNPSIPLEGQYAITISRSASGEPVDGVKVLIEDDSGDNTYSDDLLQSISALTKTTQTFDFTEGGTQNLSGFC